MVASAEVVELSSADVATRTRLLGELHALRAEHFEGAEQGWLEGQLLGGEARRSSVLVERDARGAAVGYLACWALERTLLGRPSIVLHGEALRGEAPQLDGGALLRLLQREALREALRRPDTPVYYFSWHGHPSSYAQLVESLRRVWPSRELAPTPQVRAFLSELGDGLGLARAGEDPLVRRTAWRAPESEAERTYWSRSTRPDVRFFLEHNPRYAEGEVLLTLAPLSAASLAASTTRSARLRGRRVVEGVERRVRALPGLARILTPAEVRRRLREVPLFAGLEEGQLEPLVSRAACVRARASEVLFRAGELDASLYVLDEGSVQILVQRRGGEEHVVEQLGPGEVFGEIAALSGEPRSATARAATEATLLRLEPHALREAMDADPALRESLWARYAERRFEDVATGHAAFAGSTREERLACLREGEATQLEAGGEHAFVGGFLWVPRGEFDLHHADGTLRARGPLLLEAPERVRVVARGPLSLVRLQAPGIDAAERAQYRADPLLARLPEESFDALLRRARLLRCAAGQELFVPGDTADAVYLVRSGAVEFLIDGEPVGVASAGGFFGERAFEHGNARKRTAGARTLGPTLLWRIPAEEYLTHGAEHLAHAHAPAEAQALRDGLTTLLGDAFARAPTERVLPCVFEPGQVIFREGDAGDAAYFVLEGEVKAEREGALLGRMGPGQCFGERALLTAGPRYATVTAETRVVAKRVEAQEFLRWYESHPGLRDLLATMSQVHQAATSGAVTTVHRGTHAGAPSVTSVTRLPGGVVFTAIKLEQRPVLVLTADDGAGPATDFVDFERAPQGTRLRLGYRERRAVSLLLEGDLTSSAAGGERLRLGQPLTRGELERFRWTGRLGAPASGEERLLCGCVGVTRRELTVLQGQGCASLEAVCARSGAGSVCGGCVPLLRRLLEDPTAEHAPPKDRTRDEVDLESFEARIDELRHVDSASSLCGPETVTWRVFGESAAILGGLRALLLQFAHPAAQALVDHSSFLREPSTRFHRTLQYMYGMAFGEGSAMLRLAREVHSRHATVTGRYRQSTGRVRAGERYSANQVELMLWVAATVLDTSVLTHEALVGPLTVQDKDRLVSEAVLLYGLFGIPKRRFPQTWAAFRAYFDGVLTSGELHVGDDSRALANAVLGAPRIASGPVFYALRRLTSRWLPPHLRAPFGLEDGLAERALGAALERTVRATLPTLPYSLRVCPARLHAERRMRGDEGPEPAAMPVEKLLAFMLGAGP